MMQSDQASEKKEQRYASQIVEIFNAKQSHDFYTLRTE